MSYDYFDGGLVDLKSDGSVHAIRVTDQSYVQFDLSGLFSDLRETWGRTKASKKPFTIEINVTTPIVVPLPRREVLFKASRTTTFSLKAPVAASAFAVFGLVQMTVFQYAAVCSPFPNMFLGYSLANVW